MFPFRPPLQEFFQSLECHMILTQTFYRKVSGLVAPRESQALEETMSLAQSVLKQAHRRGVELEGILEVSMSSAFQNYLIEESRVLMTPVAAASHGAGLWKTTRLCVDSWRPSSAASPRQAWWRRPRRDSLRGSVSTR